jgi:hypothetical protein
MQHAACPRSTGQCNTQKNFHAILQTCYLVSLQTSSMKLCGVGSMGSMEVLMQGSCVCKAFLPGNHF